MPADRADHARLLDRVRAGLGRTCSAVPPDRPRTDAARTVSAGVDLVRLFVANASAAGMNVHETTAGALLPHLRSLVDRLALARIAISVEEHADRELVSGAAPQQVRWRQANDLDALYDSDAGITDVLAAVAETGSLVIRSSSSTSRGGFLVPPVHIALVPASKILPDLVDLWPLLHPAPTSAVIVTGPSKTADIEGILVTGVHGPREVHIFLLRDR